MKFHVFIFMFFSLLANGQQYHFETIDKRTPAPSWEIRTIPGTVTFSETEITINTAFNTQILEIINQHQFIRQNDKIFMCLNNAGQSINLRLCSDFPDKKFCELYYYSDEPGAKYFRFCLTKIETKI